VTTLDQPVELSALDRLARDVRSIASDLGRDEVHGLVDLYYRVQEHRIALGNQSSALARAERPTALLDHFHAQLATIERQVTSALDAWTASDAGATWARSQVGIGAILAAGCVAHIDITKAPTFGSIWRFFGLDPSVTWGKGEKRPWNAEAKVLAWKIGASFVKVSGRDDAFYGKVYRDRKQYEVDRDLAGGNAAAAATKLERQRITDPTLRRTLESGHLAPGQLDQRARRYATKLFLSHLHEVLYEAHYGTAAPVPYAIEHLGHAHRIARPA